MYVEWLDNINSRGIHSLEDMMILIGCDGGKHNMGVCKIGVVFEDFCRVFGLYEFVIEVLPFRM